MVYVACDVCVCQGVVVRNFKSIGELELELRPGVNLLVGPNGAGKSNVLEAVRFARRALVEAASPYLPHAPDYLSPLDVIYGRDPRREMVLGLGKRGIRLVSIEEIAEPLSVLLVNLLANRRGDMLIRLFDQLIPSFMTRTYYYYEYMDYNRGDVYATSFKATVKVHERFYSEVFGDLVELLSELSMRMGKTGECKWSLPQGERRIATWFL